MPRAGKMAAKMAALLWALSAAALGGPGLRPPEPRAAAEPRAVSLPLEHSFELDDTPRFRRRGTLTWTPGADPPLALAQKPLSDDERSLLRAVAARDGLYRLRVPRKPPPPGEEPAAPFVSSFVRACALLESGLRERLSLHVDGGGQVVALGVVALPGPCRGHHVPDGHLQHFNTSLALRPPLPAATPETAAFIRHLEQEQAQRGRNPQEQKSFFAKYWMYIIPIVLFLMMSGAPDAGGGQGGGSGGGGGAGGR